jgi:hypothetical protein
MNITPTPWEVESHPDYKYPDIILYDVKGHNPDFGKSGVCYSGEHFGIVSGMDSKDDAYLIAAAPDMYQALKDIIDGYNDQGLGKVTYTSINKAVKAVLKAEGK